MKKLLYVGVLSTLLLVGCAEDQATPKEETSTTTNEDDKKVIEEVEALTEKSKSVVNSGEIKDGPLTKVGQWTMDGVTKVTLVKINDVGQTYDVGPLLINVKSIKLLNFSNTNQVTIEAIKNVHGKDVSKELNAIQVDYTVENTSDQNIMFTAIQKITTDTKAQIEGIYDMSGNNVTNSLSGQVIIEGSGLYPYFNGSLEDINEVNIITSHAFDTDTNETIVNSQKIEINL